MNREAAAHALLGRAWAAVEADVEQYMEAGDARVEQTRPLVFGETLPELPGTQTSDETPARVATGKRLTDAVWVGYDPAGKAAVARYHTQGNISIEAVWTGDVLLRFAHEPAGAERVVLRSIVQADIDTRGRPLELRWWFDGWRARRERFVWEADRLVQKITEEFDEQLGDPEALRDTIKAYYEYDAVGLLRVRWTGDYYRPDSDPWSDRGVSWVRRSEKALKAARDLVKTELPRRILDWVTRVAPDEPVFGLALMYSVDDPTLPPALGLGTAAELREWKRSRPESLRDYVWNPAEYKTFDPQPREFDEEALVDAFALLNADWALGEVSDEPARTLRQCARVLHGTVDWQEVVRCHEDFCIFVTPDEHDESFESQLRKSVSGATMRRLERLD